MPDPNDFYIVGNNKTEWAMNNHPLRPVTIIIEIPDF